MKYRVLAAIVLVACFAMFFQNCGMQVRFGSPDGKLEAKPASLEEARAIGDVSLIGTDGTGDGGGVPTPTMTPNESPTPTPTSTPTSSATPAPSATAHGHNDGQSTPTPTSTVSGDSGQGSGGELNYVCILNGPGKSLLLSYVDKSLTAETSTPDTVCTTKRGCEEIVSQKFDLKEARYHSDCDHNKHMVHISEDTLKTLVDGAAPSL